MKVHCRLNPLDKASARGKPVPFVHVDYTTKSGYERLEALVPKEEAERLRKTPFAAIQVSASTAVHFDLEGHPDDMTARESSVNKSAGIVEQVSCSRDWPWTLDPQLFLHTLWGP